MEYVEGKYFCKEVFKDIYLIGCIFNNENVLEKSWVEMSDKYELGKPTGNSWLIKGKEKALLIDSAAPVKGLRKFAEEITQMPVMFVASHGHFDHVFCLEEFEEFWIHKDDMGLLHGDFGFPPYKKIPSKVHFLDTGDKIELGDHCIEVINIKGHSDGSLLFLDNQLGVIFTGDSIARRILLYDVDRDKIKKYINEINSIRKKDFKYICSCHDRVPLSKKYIDYMLNNLIKIEGISTTRTLFNNQFGEFYTLKIGDERTEQYVNCSIVSNYRDDLVNVLKEVRCIEEISYD